MSSNFEVMDGLSPHGTQFLQGRASVTGRSHHASPPLKCLFSSKENVINGIQIKKIETNLICLLGPNLAFILNRVKSVEILSDKNGEVKQVCGLHV